jgi:lipopolysaccharide export system protein LptC
LGGRGQNKVTGTQRLANAQEKVAVGRDPRARAYAQARRHSARVRFYKRAIPICTAVAVTIVLVFAIADPFGRLTGLTLGPISLSGTKLTMESPRMTGFRKDTRPYEVTATSASQDVRNPNVIELTEMKARLAMDDNGGAARLEAATGVFDTQRERLELHKDVRVTTDSGQEARLKSASIDFKAGTVLSREAVTVNLANGVIEAEGLEISEGGKAIVFKGRVRTVFDGPADMQPPQGVVASEAAGQLQPVQISSPGAKR